MFFDTFCNFLGELVWCLLPQNIIDDLRDEKNAQEVRGIVDDFYNKTIVSFKKLEREENRELYFYDHMNEETLKEVMQSANETVKNNLVLGSIYKDDYKIFSQYKSSERSMLEFYVTFAAYKGSGNILFSLLNGRNINEVLPFNAMVFAIKSNNFNLIEGLWNNVEYYNDEKGKRYKKLAKYLLNNEAENLIHELSLKKGKAVENVVNPGAELNDKPQEIVNENAKNIAKGDSVQSKTSSDSTVVTKTTSTSTTAFVPSSTTTMLESTIFDPHLTSTSSTTLFDPTLSATTTFDLASSTTTTFDLASSTTTTFDLPPSTTTTFDLPSSTTTTFDLPSSTTSSTTLFTTTTTAEIFKKEVNHDSVNLEANVLIYASLAFFVTAMSLLVICHKLKRTRNQKGIPAVI
jgi:hypothetical protein